MLPVGQSSLWHSASARRHLLLTSILLFLSLFTFVKSSNNKKNNQDYNYEKEAPLGLGYFEEWERQLSSSASHDSVNTTNNNNNNSNNSNNKKSMVDVRVSRAIGSRGYDKVRLSVISTVNRNNDDDDDHDDVSSPEMFFIDGDDNVVNFTYHEKFRLKWKSAYDLGTSSVSCSEVYRTIDEVTLLTATWEKNGDYNHHHHDDVVVDATCLEACSNDPKCKYYTYFPGHKGLIYTKKPSSSPKCELSSSCDYVPNKEAEATYAKAGDWHLRSAIVSVKPGNDQHQNRFIVDDQEITISIPSQHEGTKGVIIADPCFSGRWIHCKYGQKWNTYHRTIEMMNALAMDTNLHFFQILGDNFYDQDGRLTKLLFDELSSEVKSKILLTVPGNHDVFVCGGPECADRYDQYGFGFMQYYAQDTIFSAHVQDDDDGDNGGFLHFTDNIDMPQSGQNLDNDPANFFQYHMIGNLGFIGYTGTSTFEEVRSYFEEACSYMAEQGPSFVFLLGHWNSDSSGCQTGMAVPEVHEKLQTMHGCNIGDRLKYFDGHTHKNTIQQKGQNEQVGFMIGGHGMHTSGKHQQYGFAYVDSSIEGRLRIYYFEEQNEKDDNHENILNCFDNHGGSLDECVHLAYLWLDTEIPPKFDVEEKAKLSNRRTNFNSGDWTSSK